MPSLNDFCCHDNDHGADMMQIHSSDEMEYINNEY